MKDETIICRCEDISLGEIRERIAKGARGSEACLPLRHGTLSGPDVHAFDCAGNRHGNRPESRRSCTAHLPAADSADFSGCAGRRD